MAKKPETLFKEKFNARLKEIDKQYGNLWWVKTQQVTIRGTPDILLCVNGTFIAIELKSAEGEASPLQRHNLEQIKRAKGHGLVVFPENAANALELITFVARGTHVPQSLITFLSRYLEPKKKVSTRSRQLSGQQP